MFGLPIHGLDAAILTIVVISAVIGFARGFVRETLAVGAWVGAVLATLYGFDRVRDFVGDYVSPAFLAGAIAGATIFVTTLLILSGLARVLGRRARASVLGLLDRSAGAVFGLLRAAFIISALYLLLALIGGSAATRPAWAAGSRLLPWAEVGGDVLVSLLPEGWMSARSRKAWRSRSREVFEKLKQTLPAPESFSDSPDETGYNRDQRRELNTLIRKAEDR